MNSAADALLALYPDATAVSLDNRFTDVEAEADSSRLVAVHLPEALEDRLQKVSGNARPAIRNGKTNVRAGALSIDADAPPFLRVLNGVRDQIHEHLQQTRVIELADQRSIDIARQEGNPFAEAESKKVSTASEISNAASARAGTTASLPASMLATSSRSPISLFERAAYR